MTAAVKDPSLSTGVWGHLPPSMRVLFIAGPRRTGGWLAEAFAADGASEITMIEARGVAEGLAKLRDEVFDAVLVSHEGEGLDALELLDAIRAGSSESQPVIVLGTPSEQELSAHCFEAGGDAYVCVNTTTTRTLLWRIAFARERHQLLAENHKLRNAQRHQLELEHDEANRLLQQQRNMLSDLESLYPQDGAGSQTVGRVGERCLEEVLVDHYRELLRAYVIMGSGNLVHDMNQLAELLATAQISAHQTMRLHLSVLEDMVQGLGSRSARHVMNRADMLILEIIMNLAEEYRNRALKREATIEQLWLPGFAGI